jgi:SAM-dependent methyltransferase
MDDYAKVNQAMWDELADIHIQSTYYNVKGFKNGQTSLRPFEIEEVGEVEGKSLLHLQCHFGLDTLSWARRGAVVTGMDFSPRAIEIARSLAKALDIPARFIQSDLYDLPSRLDETFDIVYTSIGVLTWLPDLKRWGEVVGRFLKPGGVFYIAEFHPFLMVFENEGEVTGLRIGYPYFASPEPIACESDESYADPAAHVEHRMSYQWQYSLGDVLNSLIAAGLRIEFLHEFPFCADPIHPLMNQSADGFWCLEGDPLPLMFSIRAVKEGFL